MLRVVLCLLLVACLVPVVIAAPAPELVSQTGGPPGSYPVGTEVTVIDCSSPYFEQSGTVVGYLVYLPSGDWDYKVQFPGMGSKDYVAFDPSQVTN